MPTLPRTIRLKLSLIALLVAAAIVAGLVRPNLQVKSQAFLSSIGPSSCSASQSFDGTLFGLTANSLLVNFNPGAPGTILSTRQIIGLTGSENIVAIDSRPATGQLVALSDAGRIYTVDPASGQATLVGTGALGATLAGTRFGFDFNPTVDRIRLTSNTGQDLRLNPNTGVLAATDATLAYAATDPNASATPSVVSIAYSNSFAGATSTTLYGIDSNTDTLVTQGSVNSAPVSPNTGQLFTVGALGVNTTNLVGFDILPGTNAAFASLTTDGSASSTLYAINLTTGAAQAIGAIGGGLPLLDLAAATSAENIFAITSTNMLLRFTSGTPNLISSACAVTGLTGAESLVAIDTRPATGQLFALTDAGRVYTINASTCAAMQVGTAALTPALSGTNFDLDFNPTVDRIRLVANTGQDLRLNPITGTVAAIDGTLAYSAGDPNAGAQPNITGAAYTNNFVGATSTVLYGIDATLNTLVTQGTSGPPPVSPNSGQLFTVGALGVDPGNDIGFDISTATGAAFASFNIAGNTTAGLYAINLATGAATLIGPIGTSSAAMGTIRDIAIEFSNTATTPPSNVFAVTASGKLISFGAGTPGTINMSVQVTGLESNDFILGIDFRPATGQLFALTNLGRIYTINPRTGAATRISAAEFSPGLNGARFGFNFNPQVDRIRLTSDSGQNLRFNPNTGAVAAVDTNLAYAAGDANAGQTPRVLAVSYTNSFTGTSSTTLFGIDTATGALVRQGSANGSPVSPNTGQLFTIGSLGVATGNVVGFDIAPGTNAALASLTPTGGTTSTLYAVNLMTGAATPIGAIGGGEAVTALSISASNNTGITTGFDICLQDDHTGDSLQFDSCTGDYQFTRCGVGGFTLNGRGLISRGSNTLTLRDVRVAATVERIGFSAQMRGQAVIRPSVIGTSFLVNDSLTGDNTCRCR